MTVGSSLYRFTHNECALKELFWKFGVVVFFSFWAFYFLEFMILYVAVPRWFAMETWLYTIPSMWFFACYLIYYSTRFFYAARAYRGKPGPKVVSYIFSGALFLYGCGSLFGYTVWFFAISNTLADMKTPPNTVPGAWPMFSVIVMLIVLLLLTITALYITVKLILWIKRAYF